MINNQQIKQIVTEFKQKHPDIKIPPIKVSKRLTRINGRILFRRVDLSPIRIELSYYNLKDFDACRHTLLHELAHLVALVKYKHKEHGEVWQNIAVNLGISPSKHANMSSYKYNCSCSEHVLPYSMHVKLIKGKKYYCKDCKTNLY